MSKKSILTFITGTLLGSIVSILTTRFMLLYEFSKERKHERYWEDDNEHSYDNVRVESERKAKEIKRKLQRQIVEHGYVTVANLHELAGNDRTWTDTEYGWTSLNGMSWTRTHHSYRPYLLILPCPRNIRDLK